MSIVLKHHAILVRLGINRGYQPLAEGVIQRVIDLAHADTQAAGAVAIDIDIGHQSLVLPVAADVRQRGQGSQLIHKRRNPCTERLQRVGLKRKLVLGAADLSIDGQILGGLQIQRHAWHVRHRLLQTGNHRLDAVITLIERLKVDLQPGAVERGIGAVHANE